MIASQPARIRMKVVQADMRWVRLDIYLHGDLLTASGPMIVRHTDMVYLVKVMDPEIVIVNRETITDTAWSRLRGFKQIELI